MSALLFTVVTISFLSPVPISRLVVYKHCANAALFLYSQFHVVFFMYYHTPLLKYKFVFELFTFKKKSLPIKNSAKNSHFFHSVSKKRVEFLPNYLGYRLVQICKNAWEESLLLLNTSQNKYKRRSDSNKNNKHKFEEIV